MQHRCSYSLKSASVCMVISGATSKRSCCTARSTSCTSPGLMGLSLYALAVTPGMLRSTLSVTLSSLLSPSPSVSPSLSLSLRHGGYLPSLKYLPVHQSTQSTQHTARFDMYDSALKRYYVIKPKRGSDVRKLNEKTSTRSQEMASRLPKIGCNYVL